MRQFSWTDRVLAISEDRPYHSELTVTGEQDLSMKGESIFHLENGGLKFWFYINDEEPEVGCQKWTRKLSCSQ